MLQGRVDELEAERRRMLDLLLGRVVPNRRAEVRAVETTEERPIVDAEQGEPASFSTPFDSTKARFRAAHKGGAIPAEYKARMN